MRRFDRDRSKLDRVLQQEILNSVGGELGPVIGLQPLDGEGEFIENLLQEPQRIGSRPAWEERDHEIARTIIDGGVLIQTRRDYDRIHLNARSWHLAGIATRLFWPSMATQGRYMLTAKYLLDGGRRKQALVEAL